MDCGSQNQCSAHPPGTPAVKCLLCCKLVFLTEKAPGGEGDLEVPREHIVNLCLQMKLDEKVIPKQCYRSMFPFCHECYLRIGFLEMCARAAVHDEAKVTPQRIATIVKRIRNTVLDSEFLLNPEKQNPDPDAELEAQKFHKLREMIIKAFREEWILEMKTGGNDLSNLPLGAVEEDLNPLNLEGLADAPISTLENCADASAKAIEASTNPPATDKTMDCICRQIIPSLQNRPRWSLTPQLKFKRHYMQFVHKKFCSLEQDNLE